MSPRPLPGRLAPLYGAAGALALTLPLLEHNTGWGDLMFLAAVAAVGGLGGSLIARPLTANPVGRVELGLRVAVGAAVVTAAVALARAAGPLGLHANVAAALTATYATLLFSVIAVATWMLRLPAAATVAPFSIPDSGSDEPLPPLCAGLKRVTDVVIALAVLPFCLPVMAAGALAVVIDSRGGWRYVQTRLGCHGRPFRLMKLRTMAADNDDSDHRAHMTALITGQPVPPGLYGKIVNDSRRTRVGIVLRRFSIDELPQLWNVLKGDMSIVGPRPPLPWEAELYSDRMWRRLGGKPGLTGLWQVEGRGRVPFSEMIELDLGYWESWSPWLDLKILARTPKAVLSGGNTG